MIPTLFLHSALGNGQQMNPIAHEISPNQPFLCPDFEGHTGESPKKAFRIQDMANQICQLINVASQEKPIIFGYSMGGYVGAYLAIHFPETIGGLITWGTRWDWHPAYSSIETQKLERDYLLAHAPTFVEQLKLRFGESNWELVLSRTTEMMNNLGNCPPILEADWQKIQGKVLILRGERDKMVSEEESIHVAKLIPNATYEEVPGQSHFLEKADIAKIKEIISKH